MNQKKHWWLSLIAILVPGILLGALLAAFSPGEFLSGLWRSALYCTLLAALFFLFVKLLKPSRAILLIAIGGFLLRIGVGIWLTTALPAQGYDTPVQNAGYAYSDAYERDEVAYMKAFPERWDDFIPSAYQGMDQYGGLLSISVAIYYLFSADVQRPLLIVFLSALAMGSAVLFLWKALQLRWGQKIALVAAVVLAFYPEGVVLGSSQMREPLLICLAAATFWLVLRYEKGERQITLYVAFALASLLACWISLPAGAVTLVVEVGYLLVQRIAAEAKPGRRVLLAFVFTAFLLAALYVGWRWLKETLYYDAYVTETESGMIAYLLKLIGTKWRMQFVMLYGLIQPLLPAALIYPSLPVWQGIAIFRAVGWYFVVPFLLYSAGAVITSQRQQRDWGLVWLVLMLIVWTFVSSARAGGDLWDNPRYRAIFLPWLSLIVGWVWARLAQGRHPWFWRIVFLESVFVIIFTNWYLNRKYAVGLPVEIQYLLVGFVVLMFAVIVGGILVDRRARKKVAVSHKPS